MAWSFRTVLSKGEGSLDVGQLVHFLFHRAANFLLSQPRIPPPPLYQPAPRSAFVLASRKTVAERKRRRKVPISPSSLRRTPGEPRLRSDRRKNLYSDETNRPIPTAPLQKEHFTQQSSQLASSSVFPAEHRSFYFV